MNYSYLRIINPSYRTYKPTERYRPGAPPCRTGPKAQFERQVPGAGRDSGRRLAQGQMQLGDGPHGWRV